MGRRPLFLLLLAAAVVAAGLLLAAAWDAPALTAWRLGAAGLWIAAAVTVTRRQIEATLPGTSTKAQFHLGTAFTWAAYRVLGPVWGTAVTAASEFIGLNMALGWRRDPVVQFAQVVNPLLPYLLASTAARYLPVGYSHPLGEVAFAAAGILVVEVMTMAGVAVRRRLWQGEATPWSAFYRRARATMPTLGALEWLLGVAIWGLWPLLGPVAIMLALGICLVVWRIFALEQQVREQQVEHQKALQAASTDALTGLYNRHHLELCLARPEVAGHANAVIVLDLDGFKAVNDQLGHPVGDQVLRLLARTIRAHVREGDICARYGGDEFVILSRVSNPAGARGLAQRILDGFRDQVAGWPVSVTLSAGVATMPEDGDFGEVALHLADQRLLHAKALGRDRVVGPGAEPAGPAGAAG